MQLRFVILVCLSTLLIGFILGMMLVRPTHPSNPCVVVDHIHTRNVTTQGTLLVTYERCK